MTTPNAGGNSEAPATDLMVAGEALWLDQLAATADGDFAGPSLLEGWDRAHLIGHLAGNAQALCNLITWANTGVETPMYPDTSFRAQQIEQYAALDVASLRELCVSASAELLAAWRSLPIEAWATRVRSAQGRDIPVSEICWMRSRENHIHAVDLNEGLTFAQLPTAFLDPLLVDVARMLGAKGAPAVTLRDEERTMAWQIGDAGDPGNTTVIGPTWALAQWAAGRGRPDGITSTGEGLPPLPPWL